MAKGKHYGAFAKSFMDSVLAVYKLSLTRDLYAARENYYNHKGLGNGKGINDPELSGVIKGGHDNAFGGGGDGGGGTVGGDTLKVAGDLRDHLMQTYGLTKDQATGFVGTLGYESGGFKTLQEQNPVGGGRGGWGYAQWTGPRRDEFDAVTKANGLNPNSYEANVAMLDHELTGKYAGALEEVKKTTNVADAAKATLVNYEGMPDTEAIRAQGGIPATQKHIDYATQLDKQLSAPGSASPGTQVGSDTTLSQPSKIMTSNAGSVSAPGGGAPKAFIMHHTVIGGSPQDIVDFWKKQGKGYGAQYIMDRDGVVHDTQKEFGYSGTNEILNDQKHGLTNGNVVGMEIIAKNDKDVTPAQAKAAAAFVRTNYPTTPVYGHGQVNPGHKEATEGMTAVNAVNADRGSASTTPTKGPNKGKPPATNVANEPSKDAQPVEADTANKSGGFTIPGTSITIGGVHPENIFQHHPRNSPTLGPVFPGPPSGSNAAPSPGPHGDAPPDVPTPETMYDKTNAAQTVRPEAPMAGVRGNPAPAGARPEPPAIPPTPQPPQPVGARPDAPMEGVHGLPLFNAVRPEAPLDQTPASPVVNTVRPDAPPTVTARPSTVGEDNPATRNMPYVGETASGNQVDPKGVYAPTAYAKDSGARPDLTARSPATSANVPSKDAQPVSSPALPSNPQGNVGGFVTIDRPNASPNERNRGSPQGTALDLSHLWGPNPPLSQQPNTPSASAPTPTPAASSPLPTRLPDDMADNAALGMDIMGSAKGGPIGFRQGGAIPAQPTMKFAAAGAVPYATYDANPAPSMGMFNAGAYANPNMQLWRGGEQWLGSQSTSPYSAQAAETTPGGVQADIDALPANLRTWYNQQNANAMSGGGGGSGNNWFYNIDSVPTAPAAATPAATPAAAPAAAPAPVAPTVVNVPTSSNPQAVDPVALQAADPTTTTVTGAVKVPNSIQAKSYDPNVDAQTGAGFANTSNTGGTDYSVGSDDLLKQNASGQISGNGDTTILSRKGGPIPRVTQRVNSSGVKRYDDGGGVSPSAAGMPPGLGGQGAIPPIYYNPATYAGAGAPVGKGISQNSAPTFGAGAIPSLPMVQGGAVKAFADGGGIGGDDDLATMQSLDFDDARRDDGGSAAPATPTSDKDPGWYINPNDTSAQAAPAPTSGNVGAPTDHTPPPDPMTPQIHDDAGNPSKGLIGAISDGLHWLGEHLGLTGGGQNAAVASSPEQNQRQQQFASGQNVGGMTPENYEELNKLADPTGNLKEGYRNLAGLEAGYRWALAKGDDATASRLAASYLHYSVNLSQNLSAKAQDALYAGDLKKAVDFTNQAVQAVPDGRNIHMELSPDGRTVKVTGSTLTGRQLWQKYGAAPEILERASSLGKTGKLQWDALESQAAKYDSTFAGMQKARITNAGAQAKEDADTKAQADANEQIAKLGPQFGDQNAPTPAPPNADIGSAKPSAPAAPVASTSAPPTQPAIPGLTPPPASPLIEQANAPVTRGVSGDGGGSSQTAAAPPDADQANAAPTRPAIPGPPTRENAALAQAGPQPINPNAPAPDSQDVDLEHSVAYQSIPGQVKPNFFASDGRPIVGGQVMNRPPVMDAVTLKSYAPQVQAAYNERWKEYNEAVQQNTAQMNSEIDGRRRDVAADIASGREQRGRAFTEQQANNRTGFQQQQENVRIAAQIKAKQESEQAARDHEDFAPRPDAEWHKVFAVEPDAKGVISGKQPQDYYKDQAATMPDGSIDTNQRDTRYNQEFNDRNQRVNMNTALINAYRYTKDGNPVELADALRGAALGDYTATPAAMKPYGNTERIAVTITRPSDKSTVTVILPRQDWLNLQGIHNAKLALKDQNQADTAAPINNPYRAPPPSGQSANVPSAIANWWKGTGIPYQPTQ